MYKNNLNWYDINLQKEWEKDKEYQGKDKNRIKELMGDNLHGIAFIRLEEDEKERKIK